MTWRPQMITWAEDGRRGRTPVVTNEIVTDVVQCRRRQSHELLHVILVNTKEENITGRKFLLKFHFEFDVKIS